jgi:hypothetical protein
MTANEPTVALTVGDPATLDDVKQWASLAEELGFPSASAVTVSYVPRTLTVTCWLGDLR